MSRRRKLAFQFMASRGVRSSLFVFLVIFFVAFVFLFGGVFSGGFWAAPSGRSRRGKQLTRLLKRGIQASSQATSEDRDGDRPYLRDRLKWNWNQRGRSVPPGESAAGLRLRTYRQKMAMRARRAAATPAASSSTHPPKRTLGGVPALTPASASTAVWTPLGPAPLASDATGDGGQDYNWVSGRATSVLIDPADTSGNTVLLGGAYGGLWKSTNAGSQSSSPASVTWQAFD